MLAECYVITILMPILTLKVQNITTVVVVET